MVDDLRKASFVASGRVGTDWVYQSNGVRREYVIPTNPQTATQQAWRYQFGDVQKELVMAGEDVREALRDALGYRWHALALGQILEDDGAWWDEFASVFSGFDASDQYAWAKYDGLEGQQNAPGLVFFIVASGIYRILKAETRVEPYQEPSNGNPVEIAEAWERAPMSGRYTPDVNLVSNVDGVTILDDFLWFQVGNMIMFSGALIIDPTASGQVIVGLSLPVASDFAGSYDLNGNITSPTESAGSVISDGGNNRANIYINATSGAARYWRLVAMMELL